MIKILTRTYIGTLVSIDNIPMNRRRLTVDERAVPITNTIKVVRLTKQHIRAGAVSFGQPYFEWFTALDLDPKENIVFHQNDSIYTLTGVAVSESTFDSTLGYYTRGIAANMSPSD